MKLVHSLSLALAIFVFGSPARAADEAAHQAHHPAGTASAPAPKATPAKPSMDMGRMDAQMKAMREMHARMMAAKAPSEREALMSEHMKTMQDGMTMMNDMSAGAMKGGMADHHRTMEARMEMMQTMMQMMMDRLPAAPMK